MEHVCAGSYWKKTSNFGATFNFKETLNIMNSNWKWYCIQGVAEPKKTMRNKTKNKFNLLELSLQRTLDVNLDVNQFKRACLNMTIKNNF